MSTCFGYLADKCPGAIISDDMNIYLTALGCRLNQAETEDMARKLETLGQNIVDDAQMADRIVVNTCTVTHVADRKSRQLIRRLHRLNPAAGIAVTGCYAETSREVIDKLDGVDLVVSNGDKERIVELLLQHEQVPLPVAIVASSGPLKNGHTRAFVKIQDGCDNACSYCIVTMARGAQKSLAPERVIERICRRIDEGYREVVLTGVHIGAYGRDSHPAGALPPEKGWSLARLVQRILDETDVERLRLSSLEPWDFSNELLTLWHDERLCNHLHLPLQSGSDAVLKAMNRDYTTDYFARLVESLRAAIPNLSLTTDVIVGFPGETDALFEESTRFVEAMAFAKLHIFRYSPRPGTLAAELDGAVPSPVIDERARQLAALSRRLGLRFNRQFVGQQMQVLFEHCADDSTWDGLSTNYCRVKVKSEQALRNHLGQVLVERADSASLTGRLIMEEG